MKKLLLRWVRKNLRRHLSYRKLVEISNIFNFPLVLSIQITMRCNSKCKYCDIWRLKEDSESLPLDTLERIFNSLRNLGVRIISLTGDEPLIRKDISDVIRLAKHYGFQFHICTNGIYLTKSKAIELVDAGVSSIGLSLDTLDPEIYEIHRGVPFKFAEQALETLSFIAEKYPNIHCLVSCVITKHNIRDIFSFAEKISEYGRGKILINLQPYHLPVSLSEIKMWLDPEIANKLWSQNTTNGNLNPDPELKPIFEKETERFRKELSLNNSVLYLRSTPDFLSNNKLPSDLNCLYGYQGWRPLPVGDLRKEELSYVWFSKKYAEVRRKMKNLNCLGCLLPFHNEPGWFNFYNSVYNSSMAKEAEKWKS